MSATSLVGLLLLTFCICVGTIVLSLNPAMAEALVTHLDITDAFFGLLFLIFILAVV